MLIQIVKKQERTIKEQERIIKEQGRMIKEQEKMIKTLEARLNKYENAHIPPSKGGFVPKPTNSSKNSPKKNGRPKGHKGTTRLIPGVDKIINVRLNKCPYCKGKLDEPIKIESRIIEDIPKPQQVKVTKYQIAYYECPHCGEKVVSSHPDLPKEGRFGKYLVSKVVLLKYNERLPLRKVVEVLKRDYGLSITHSSILEITRRVASILSNSYKEILEAIRKRSVVYVDETGFKVGGRNNWLWIFTTDKETLITIRKSRGEKVIREILGNDFKEIIVSDGWKTCFKFSSSQKNFRDVGHMF